MASASSGVNFRARIKLAQVHAVHKFHEQVIKPAGLAEVINGDDVRMVQCRQRLRLARESFGKFRVIHAFRREQFQGDEAVQGFLPRLVNHAHAAASETFENFELRKMRGNLFGRQRRLCRGGVIGENGFRFQVQRHETIRAKSGGSILRQIAFRTADILAINRCSYPILNGLRSNCYTAGSHFIFAPMRQRDDAIPHPAQFRQPVFAKSPRDRFRENVSAAGAPPPVPSPSFTPSFFATAA